MSRFDQIRIDKEKKLVYVGAGCLFEEVYQALDSTGLNIVGGLGLAGVGVAGWMLGGGYSVKTSQYGLGTDNLAAVKLILPNRDYMEANDTTNKFLFSAIKGGGNNFSIVTKFTLKAHEQGKYEDFTLIYDDYFDDVKAAILNIITKQDNKANVEATFRHLSEPGTTQIQVILIVQCVYDSTYSEDPFQELDEIPHRSSTRHKNILFLKADLRRSYHNGTYSHIGEPPDGIGRFPESNSPENERPRPPILGIGQFLGGRWGNVMVDEFTLGIIDEVQKQASEIAKKMKEHGGINISIGFWPFTRAMFDNVMDSAWPHAKDKPNCPIIVYFTWKGKENNKDWIYIMKNTLNALKEKVHQECPSSKGLPYMINIAFAEATTVEDIYRGNLDPDLTELRVELDYNGVMDCMGGFRIPAISHIEI